MGNPQSAAKSLQEMRDAVFDDSFRTFRTAPADGAAIDAYGRSRVSNRDCVFESSFQWGLDPLKWDTDTTGGATAVHLAPEAVILLTTVGPSSTVTRQTKEHLPYQPGTSQQIILSGALPDGGADFIGRIGYFDQSNGIFVEKNNVDGIGWVIRSDTSGSVVDTFVPQKEWNLDKFIPAPSGEPCPSNPSGANLVPDAFQTFVIDFQWTTGRVRVGFVIEGRVRYAHEFVFGNLAGTAGRRPFMQRGSLPLTYELSGSDVGAPDLKQGESSVSAEGGDVGQSGLVFTEGSRAIFRAVLIRTPVVAYRPSLVFQGVANLVPVLPISFEVLADRDIFWEIIINPTLESGVFSPVNSAVSSVEVSVDAVITAGTGTAINSGYAIENENKVADYIGRLRLSTDSLAQQDLLVFAVNRFGAAQTNATASATWREYQ